MKIIPICSKIHGIKLVFVDDEDYDYLNQFKWQLRKDINTYYIMRTPLVGEPNQKSLLIHRVIMNVTDSKILIDHIDMDGLNNQKSNLRKCTPSENQKNKRPRGTSKYLGVNFHTATNKYKLKNGEIRISQSTGWLATISINGKTTHIKKFKNEIDAAKAYDEMAKIHHGEFANLNFKD